MGSPFEYTISSRVHQVTTDRGAAMILNKILTAAAGFEPKGQRELCFQIIEHLRADPEALKVPVNQCDDNAEGMTYQLAGDHNLWVPLTGFLEAYLLSNATCGRVVLSLGARYAWRGYERFECVIVFDTGVKLLQKRGFVSNHSKSGCAVVDPTTGVA